MRPVNLVPPEERRGEHAPLRSGPLAYIVLGALVAVLGGVTLLVLTNNQISDRKAEVAQLKREDAAAEARAKKLAAYTQFRTLREQRVETVTNLANSRFDWERVMRELSLILPRNVWVFDLTGSASPESNVGGSSGSSMRGSIAGPALELEGCATGQVAVAGFVTALKDIDGVTRVGVESSELPEPGSGGGNSGSGVGEKGCPSVGFSTKFEIVVAFDAAPAPPTESSELASATEIAQTTSSETENSESSSEGSEGSEGG
jgi:Tfp pilus assembly protein PilN